MWQAGLAVYLAYGTLLRYAVGPSPGPFLSDVAAILYVVYWLWRAPKRPLAWRCAFYWLGLPALLAAYLIWRTDVTVSAALLGLLGCYLTGIAFIRLSRGLAASACCD